MLIAGGVRNGRALWPRMRIALPWQLVRRATGRLSWGVADQAMSSLTNFAVNIYIARSLGAVSYGAFSLAYVTYSFALNASRGLATDPLLVRFSGVKPRVWRRAVRACTGTAFVTGLATGIGMLVAAILMHGTMRAAFIALGLTLPGLLLQDSWRFSFFAVGRGFHALLNDTIWAVVLIPSLVVLKMTGHASVFWFVFAWGMAAAVGALVGPIQSGVLPRPSRTLGWISAHRDLGPRYLLEGTANSGSTQLRNYAVGILLGLAAVGYVQGASTLMGPFMVIFFGMGLVTLPEAARVLRRSPQHLPLFCALVSGGLALAGLAWVAVLLVALPRGLGHVMLGSLWRPTYPLVLPLGISIIGGCISAGAGAGLHALGASKRSLRAMIQSSALYVICGVVGARLGGAIGTMDGAAISGLIGAVLFWWQLHLGLRDYRNGTVAGRGRGRHRRRHGHSLSGDRVRRAENV
jgi:O-antigen/teichoic acid export membrane protein